MPNQALMDSFKEAANHVYNQSKPVPSFSAIKALNSNFLISYEIADMAQDNDTKNDLVSTLAAFTVLLTTMQPSTAGHATVLGNSIQLLCDTLNETVEDKSFIPSKFSKALFVGAQIMLGKTGDDKYVEAINETAEKIIASARLFLPAPAPKVEAVKTEPTPLEISGELRSAIKSVKSAAPRS